MKTSFKANLLQHLIAKKEDGGFTLIELLVVIIIIGILAAIALPSFLNQANRARQSEAATYVGSINRAQQAFRLENRAFANTIPELGIGVATTTEYYGYTLEGANEHGVVTKGTPTDEVLLGYTGLVYTLQDAENNATTAAILCKALKPGKNNLPALNAPTAITAAANPIDCPGAAAEPEPG